MAEQPESGAGDTERLMAMIMALGGEVFVLKAQVQRLAQALKDTGTVGEAALEAAASSPEFRAWMSREEKAFGRALLRPFVHPDLSQDVAALLSGARPAPRERP